MDVADLLRFCLFLLDFDLCASVVAEGSVVICRHVNKSVICTEFYFALCCSAA